MADLTLTDTRRSVQSELQDLEAESLAESLPEGFNVSEKDYSQKDVVIHKYLKMNTRIRIILSISHGSIWGLLARKGLMALTSYNGSFLSGVIWANFAACLIMGLAVDSSRIWETLFDSQNYAHKGEIPVYVGITTGFCGTFSSFSSVILEIFNKTTDTLPGKYYHYPNAAYGIMEFISTTLAHFGISVIGFHIGRHMVDLFDDYIPMLSERVYYIVERALSLIGLIAFIIIVVLTGFKDNGSWRSWLFACIFAPFGALLRYYVSKYLNPKAKNFPLGTFTANILGTLLLSIFTLLGRGKLPHSHTTMLIKSILSCQVLSGLDNGFCGGLTTVSTFVTELFGLNTLHSYRYGFYSITASFIVVVLTLGIYNWTVGLTDSICT